MFNHKWSFKDYPKEKNNYKVFSTFSCGGGSTMGYKLAGYDVIASNDIDKDMQVVYKKNHNPKYYYLMPIKDLLNTELPKELYDIDILDGSPPCSTFSTQGERDKNWGKEKHFREGQAKQVLDDLFFDFIALAGKIKPKIILAENVKGMLIGNAKGYLVEIKKQLNKIGYNVQLFLLNGASMGLPQKRERVFFICSRKDLNLPNIKFDFNEKMVSVGDAIKDIKDYKGRELTKPTKNLVSKCRAGESPSKLFANGKGFGTIKLDKNKPCPTITTSSGSGLVHWNGENYISGHCLSRLSSFPTDYDYLKFKPAYLCGMSVPPIMIANIAKQIELQLLSKL